jgi:predicted nucleic acid-binding protein
VIVADSNVAAYYWINGPLTNVAQQVWLRDPEWHVPLLWRSEMRGILTGYLRDGTLTARQIAQFMAGAVGAFSDREHLVSSEMVFKITERTRLSAYDAEFVALAEVLGVPLVTAVKLVLNAFPDRAQTMQDFVAR